MLTKNELYYLIALLHIPNLAINYGHKIWQAFPNLEDFFKLNIKELKQLGINDEDITKIAKLPHASIQKNLKWSEQANNQIIAYPEARYPKLLKQIPNPPLALFVSGNIEKLASVQLAIVGSRNPTPTGKETAFEFAKDLAQSGLTITSGFAAGIDTASHNGAIAANGVTIAVMGTGLDKLYPKHHITLAQKILDHDGLLISEFPIDRQAAAHNFPLRNRIISGLTLGTLVVEAALRSGSLITARLATEQGREVFAIPGSIYNPLSRGCHSIIRQGAKLVENIQDILEELPPCQSILPQIKVQKNNTESHLTEKNVLDQNYKILLECIGFEITPIDTLLERSNYTAPIISSMLTVLELDGYIESVPGGYIKKQTFASANNYTITPK